MPSAETIRLGHETGIPVCNPRSCGICRRAVIAFARPGLRRKGRVRPTTLSVREMVRKGRGPDVPPGC